MKKLFLFFIIFIYLKPAQAQDMVYYIKSAYENNPKLNAERQKLKSVKEKINISISEFLPSVTLSGDISSTQSTNRTNQLGENLSDSNTDSETKKFSVDQKIFQGFSGLNSLKKSRLEFEKSNFELKQKEQDIIIGASKAYLDLIYNNQNKNFNLSNVDLFERQVESDGARAQKGEITLTDLAQSESSLAGANAKLIAAETELLTANAEFERITKAKIPSNPLKPSELRLNLPNSLNEAINIAKKDNPQLIIAKINYEISKRNLEIEKASLSPKASLNYSRSENDDFSASVDEIDEESFKATITWPLIKGGKNYSSIKKSRFEKEQNKLILEDVENEVKTKTANFWSKYQSSKSILISTASQLKAAEIANEGITLEYDSGDSRTTLEVIQSRSLLLDARIAHAKSERDFIISQFELLAQLGGLSINIF